jgi:hypothetical protein
MVYNSQNGMDRSSIGFVGEMGGKKKLRRAVQDSQGKEKKAQHEGEKL